MKAFKSLAKILICGILFSASSASFAQSGFRTQSITLEDSSFIGSFDTVSITIQYVDPVVYTGSVTVSYSLDNGTSFATLCSLQNITLQPNQIFTIGANNGCQIDFDSSSHFQPGPNIVVVWSSGSNKMALDSLRDSIYLSNNNGIHQINLNSSFSISPSPAKDFIAIKLNKNTPRQMQIRDVFGRQIYTEAFSGGEIQKINIQRLPAGLYFLELIYDNNTRGVQKFVKSD